MKRLLSIKLKMKRNTNNIVSKSGINHNDSIKNHSISTILALAIDPKRAGPTSQELNTISKYSKRGESESLQLKKYIIDYLILSEDKNNFNEILKILIIIDFLFVTGSREFYYIFVNGDRIGNYGEGVWKLRVLHETLAGIEEVVERIRNKISELLWMCQDHEHWETRRNEYEEIRKEIQIPTSRRSFDTYNINEDMKPYSSCDTKPIRQSNFNSFPKRKSSLMRKPTLSRINESDY